MRKNLFCLFLLSFLIVASLFASQELFDASSYEYKTIMNLCNLSGVTGPSSVTPVTKSELKMAYDRIRVEKLSDKSLALYNDVKAIFEEEKEIDFGINISPQLFLEEK